MLRNVLGIGVLSGALVLSLTISARADSFILWTADTDNSAQTDPAFASISVPAKVTDIPLISSGVTLTPSTAKLDGKATGPINGVTYGPGAYGSNVGGNTGFVTSTFVIPKTGNWFIEWQTMNDIDTAVFSGMAIDNVKLNGSVLYGFESGIPIGFTSLGQTGTSGAVTDLVPTEGTSFAWLDNNGVTLPDPADTLDGTNGSELISTPFAANAGDKLSMDLVFFTNDGNGFADFGLACIGSSGITDPSCVTPSPVSVPEPSTVVLLGSSLVSLVMYRPKKPRVS